MAKIDRSITYIVVMTLDIIKLRFGWLGRVEGGVLFVCFSLFHGLFNTLYFRFPFFLAIVVHYLSESFLLLYWQIFVTVDEIGNKESVCLSVCLSVYRD